MLDTFTQQSLALELLTRQAKIKIVHQVTGLPIKFLRKVYRQLHGRSPTPGSMKFSTRGLTGSHSKYKDVTLFAVCLQTVETKILESQVRKVIIAFDTYKKLYPSGQLDFSAAWVIAQDFSAHSIELIKCPHCKAWVLLNAREDLSERCGVCKSSLEIR